MLIPALLLGMFATAPPAGGSADPGPIAKLPSVVYLHGETRRTGAADADEMESWFREMAVTAPQRWHTAFGTGFLAMKDGRSYLVTAKHVLDAMSSRDVRVTFAGESGEPIDLRLADIAAASPPAWSSHATADVAAIELDPARLAKLATLAIRFSDIRRSADTSAASSVLMLGFPHGLGVPPRSFSPVSRWTRVASDEFLHDGRKYFVLDTPSAPGFSGAPVFERGGGSVACDGLVSGTLTDETGDAFAAIVPARLIRETLGMAEQASEPRKGLDILRK